MNTNIIKALIRDRYNSSEWALAFEVGDGTGSNVTRHADAIAMNLWPSRGLAIHGMEFKASRGDWIKELKTPEKAEAVAKYCDFWWLVTADGIVKDDEIPLSWGLIEVKVDVSGNPKLVIKKQAEKKQAVEVNRNFMAALFRRVSGADKSEVEGIIQKKLVEAEAKRNQQIEELVRVRARDYEELKARVERFTRASGFNLEDWRLQPEDFGEAVRFVMKSGVVGAKASVGRTRRHLLEIADKIGKAIDDSAGPLD